MEIPRLGRGVEATLSGRTPLRCSEAEPDATPEERGSDAVLRPQPRPLVRWRLLVPIRHHARGALCCAAPRAAGREKRGLETKKEKGADESRRGSDVVQRTCLNLFFSLLLGRTVFFDLPMALVGNFSQLRGQFDHGRAETILFLLLLGID